MKALPFAVGVSVGLVMGLAVVSGKDVSSRKACSCVRPQAAAHTNSPPAWSIDLDPLLDIVLGAEQ